MLGAGGTSYFTEVSVGHESLEKQLEKHYLSHSHNHGDRVAKTEVDSMRAQAKLQTSFYVERSNAQAGGHAGAQTEKVLSRRQMTRVVVTRGPNAHIGDGGVRGVGDTWGLMPRCCIKMPPYVLTGPASLEFLLGVSSCLFAFVLVFPFAPSAKFLATFGGPA
ncbi:hypothetical protein Scep_001493 [Stephania cephalantha]|uniref:Uncharacterized protein n=1 Tax=Stephania cephalantha TaxID=152367 RepID=A0AAP0L812_9MAGN